VANGPPSAKFAPLAQTSSYATGAGPERARFSNSCGCGAGLKFAGAGLERTKNVNPRRALVDSGDLF